MTVYNVRIAEGVPLDVVVPNDYPAPNHAARLLRLINNDLVIGTVVSFNKSQNFAILTFPMFVDMFYCEEHDEEESYEFTPYMRNLIKFDPQIPHPILFNLDHCINAAVPSDHLFLNYYKTLHMYKAISDEMLGLSYKKHVIH